MIRKLAVILVLFFFTRFVYANQPQRENQSSFLYGLGGLYKQQIYKGFDQRTIAVPVLGYFGQKLRVFGPLIEYDFVNSKNWTLQARLSPRFDGYDSDDSEFFVGLDKRKDSFDAGIKASYKKNYWTYSIGNSSDVLSNSKGHEISFDVSKTWKTNGWTITPQISLGYLDSNLVDYYYGVRDNETLPNRSFYEASSTNNTTFEVNFTKTTAIGLFRIGLNNKWYGSEITNSPLVDKNSALGFNIFYILQK